MEYKTIQFCCLAIVLALLRLDTVEGIVDGIFNWFIGNSQQHVTQKDFQYVKLIFLKMEKNFLPIFNFLIKFYK